jgi:hypothetical protein
MVMNELNKIAAEYGLSFDTSKTEFTDIGVANGIQNELPSLQENKLITKQKNMRFLGI